MSHGEQSSVPSKRRVLVFRGLVALTGLLFVAAGVTNARAGWVLVIGATGDQHAEANRWFTTVAGTADLILAGCLLALAWWPRLSLLFFYFVTGFVVAALINLPFVPEFAIVLAATVPALATYPYWADLRAVTTWWRKPRIVPLVVSVAAAAVVFTVAAVAIGRQIGGTDAAAQANWWADYAEHASLLAVAALIAGSGRPGWRILAGMAGAAWMYLGVVAVFLLPDHTASWGTLGGLLGLAIGLVLAAAAAVGDAAPRMVGRAAHGTAG
jgi:hypothetical protein